MNLRFERPLRYENAQFSFSFSKYDVLVPPGSCSKSFEEERCNQKVQESQLFGYPSLGRTGVCSTLLELRAAVVAKSVGSCDHEAGCVRLGDFIRRSPETSVGRFAWVVLLFRNGMLFEIKLPRSFLRHFQPSTGPIARHLRFNPKGSPSRTDLSIVGLGLPEG